MILPDFLLHAWARRNVAPYAPELINPMSIDLRWSGRIRVPIATYTVFEWWPNKPSVEYLDQFWHPDEDVTHVELPPGAFVLLDTLEYLTFGAWFSGLLMLKSSSGRAGMEHHHAGWFDPGFCGTGTLEITNTAPYPIRLRRGQPIVQMVVSFSLRPMRHYGKTGQYVGQRTPTPAGGNR